MEKEFHKKLIEDQIIIENLKCLYNQLEKDKMIEKAILVFDNKFPDNGISFVKKVDLILWAIGRIV